MADRIETTHVGSLPRPEPLIELLEQRAKDRTINAEAVATRLAADVADIVRRQVEIGLDAVSDGELGKVSYSSYVTERLSGFGGESRGRAAWDLRD